MTRKKWKNLKICGLLTGAIAIVVTPTIVTCCGTYTSSSNDNNNGGSSNGNNNGGSGGGSGQTQTTTIKPEINTSVNLDGNISSILGLTGSKSDIQNQLQTIVDNNKEMVIDNYDKIKQQGKDVNIKVNVTSGDDKTWSTTSYSTWAIDLNSSNIKNWAGYDSTTKTKELNITVNSKADLKTLLSENITNIATNAGINIANKTVTLANASPEIDSKTGNLLIPIEVANATKKQANNKLAYNDALQSGTNDNKYVISIPQANLFFDVTTSITANVIDGTARDNIVVDTSPVTSDSTFNFDAGFVNENYSAAKLSDDLKLPQKEQAINETSINLYKSISDLDILKALKWIDSDKEVKLNGHIDGSPIDISNLKLSQIKTTLNLSDDYIPQTITFNMQERDPSKDDFNGLYSIEVIGMKQKGNNYELKTMNFYKSVDAKSTQTNFQLTVPNAYIIDTTINKSSTDKYKSISTFADNKQFGIGTSYNTSNPIEQINNSLKKPNTWNKFLKKIKSSMDQWHYQAINGFDISFGNFNWDETNGNLLTFKLALKQGFELLPELTINKNKYNTTLAITKNSDGKTINFNFAIGVGNWGDPWAIGKITNKSVDEMETYYSTNDQWNG